MDSANLILAIPSAGVLALAYAYVRAQWVTKQDAGTDTMKEIAENIAEGARADLVLVDLDGALPTVRFVLSQATTGERTGVS